MATVKKTGVPVAHNKASSKLVPAAPESSGVRVKKRKRLAKVFSRPLDKKLRDIERVRVKVSLLADEQVQLADLKQRLAAQGVRVKKGELLGAGLLLLASLDDSELQAALAKFQPLLEN